MSFCVSDVERDDARDVTIARTSGRSTAGAVQCKKLNQLPAAQGVISDKIVLAPLDTLSDR